MLAASVFDIAVPTFVTLLFRALIVPPTLRFPDKVAEVILMLLSKLTVATRFTFETLRLLLKLIVVADPTLVPLDCAITLRPVTDVEIVPTRLEAFTLPLNEVAVRTPVTTAPF